MSQAIQWQVALPPQVVHTQSRCRAPLARAHVRSFPVVPMVYVYLSAWLVLLLPRAFIALGIELVLYLAFDSLAQRYIQPGLRLKKMVLFLFHSQKLRYMILVHHAAAIALSQAYGGYHQGTSRAVKHKNVASARCVDKDCVGSFVSEESHVYEHMRGHASVLIAGTSNLPSPSSPLSPLLLISFQECGSCRR